jgi:catechol 2,3-dioxygenase-like lactoylglutathione lyase family enzyme
MLRDATVQPMLPVKDLEVAKKFYEGALGLRRVGGAPDAAVVYQSGGSTLCVYRSEFAGTNKGTAALWEVEDVEAIVEELKAKGVTFERYDDLPGLTWKDGIHFAGDFMVAWFKDPDGNILSVQNRPAAEPGKEKT